MRRKLLVPVAGLAVVVITVLAGCTAGGIPTPTPTASETASPTPSETPTPEPTETPTTVPALPGSALLRLSVTATVGGDEGGAEGGGHEEVRLALTFSRAVPLTSATTAIAEVQRACPNAIQSQLESFPGFQPVGVLRSTLTASGDWPDGLTVAVAAGGLIATVGDGDGVAAADDPSGGFGCAVGIVTGPGDATFTSLLIGDSTLPVREALDLQVAHGRYGFESDSGPVTWKDCVVQLSSAAQRYATENDWQLPAEFGDGCLIGDAGAV